ncbi:translation initiation factor 2 [Streptomyces sp. NPDC050560]|uniref:translation initiation factor 2 n=1 Tax=Streptomyces sp. NPDC050560 TaxID=3365630 RepID=UPI00378B5AAD
MSGPKEPERVVLFAARSATALHRLLDVLPVFEGDERLVRRFTLVPGSDFDADALAALDAARVSATPWAEALKTTHALILAAGPKGELHRLRGPLLLLPHGAGFNKSLPGEGTPGRASGLDPAYLLHDGAPLAALYALAHPGQAARLAQDCPQLAARTAVVGDPTLDRMLESTGLRERYRAALGTGERTLVVLASTWGPRSLLETRPALPADLARELPVDTYQFAVIAHPNAHSDPGTLDLAERLPPEVLLAGPRQEWAALLVAADVVLCDHGSAALYAAALDRPVLSGADGAGELLPGTPMARLLDGVPRYTGPGQLAEAGGLPAEARAAADDAFTARGHALDLLREQAYRLLGLPPPGPAPQPRLLPVPTAPAPPPAAHAVRVTVVDGNMVRVERRPAATGVPSHHLAAEEDAAHARHAGTAGLLYRRAGAGPREPGVAWTAAGWTAHALGAYPACRTAAVVLTPEVCVVRRRGREGLLTVRVAPATAGGRVVRPDPAAALSAVHARLADAPGTADFRCLIGHHTHAVRVEPATAYEAAAELAPRHEAAAARPAAP